MKNKYWINENGTEVKGTAKDYRYYYNNFCKSVMDDKGDIFDKGKIPFKNVMLIYNPQGIAIAGKEEKEEKELTKEQLNRQDFVDNKITDFVNILAEDAKGNPSHFIYDSELVGRIRNAFQSVICDDLKYMTEMEFYPYLKE